MKTFSFESQFLLKSFWNHIVQLSHPETRGSFSSSAATLGGAGCPHNGCPADETPGYRPVYVQSSQALPTSSCRRRPIQQGPGGPDNSWRPEMKTSSYRQMLLLHLKLRYSISKASLSTERKHTPVGIQPCHGRTKVSQFSKPQILPVSTCMAHWGDKMAI